MAGTTMTAASMTGAASTAGAGNARPVRAIEDGGRQHHLRVLLLLRAAVGLCR